MPTVKELKAEAVRLGLSTKGTKAELQHRIKQPAAMTQWRQSQPVAWSIIGSGLPRRTGNKPCRLLLSPLLPGELQQSIVTLSGLEAAAQLCLVARALHPFIRAALRQFRTHARRVPVLSGNLSVVSVPSLLFSCPETASLSELTHRTDGWKTPSR